MTIRLSDCHPYPCKPAPATKGRGFSGYRYGFQETWGYTNPCAGTTFKLTRKPRNSIASVK